MSESKRYIDKIASERLKQRRIALGISQKDLGKAIDISAQQVQKYEEGLSIIPVSRLYVFSKILNAPLRYFTENSEKTKEETEYLFEESKNNLVNEVAEDKEEYTAHFNYKKLSRSMEREVIALVRAFTEIQSPDIRRIIIELVKSVTTVSSLDN
ncbi:helix-turn-helix domain-containing protein [Rickettsia endosymbiont of Halotydeus destructor]|uniref:helix-turn-helix domain-containing protein n=1 Tax=Rickettsia endosymbiont of Halotydeus destructor TaxID=2996754 RepID=UPI003BB162CD